MPTVVTYQHPNPALRRQGARVISPAADLATTDTARAPGVRAINATPVARIETAHFYLVNVDSPFVPDGQHGWYGLKRIRPGREVAGLALLHVSAQLAPTDNQGAGLPGGSGAGWPDAIAWGTSRGTGAAIVIGKNLPCEQGQWAFAPASIPGIDPENAAADPRTLNSAADGASPGYYATFFFPAGSWNDAAILRDPREHPLGGAAARIGRSDTLDVALVVCGQQLNGQTGGLAGHAYVELVCADVVGAPPLRA